MRCVKSEGFVAASARYTYVIHERVVLLNESGRQRPDLLLLTFDGTSKTIGVSCCLVSNVAKIANMTLCKCLRSKLASGKCA